MNSQDAVDLGREAITECLMMGGPILIAGLVIGLIVGILQAMTQVHDQTVAFVPKVLGMCVIIALGLPWLSQRMIDYTRTALEKPIIAVPLDGAGIYTTSPAGFEPAGVPSFESFDSAPQIENNQVARTPIVNPVSFPPQAFNPDRQQPVLSATDSAMQLKTSQQFSMPVMTPQVSSSMPILQSGSNQPANGTVNEADTAIRVAQFPADNSAGDISTDDYPAISNPQTPVQFNAFQNEANATEPATRR